jgi:predicted  nucleic acid-binding Zn-ribbon protein
MTVTSTGEHEICVAAGQINSLEAQLAELSLRLEKVEQTIDEFESKSSIANQLSSTELKSTIQQLQSVSSQVEVITEGLRSTAGYNISKTFHCSSCGSAGVIAMKIKCTKCGQENWWGWWPGEK